MARRVIEVDGGDDQVGDWDQFSSFRKEGEKGDEIVPVIVSLVVEDYTCLVWRMVRGRHVFTRWWKLGSR